MHQLVLTTFVAIVVLLVLPTFVLWRLDIVGLEAARRMVKNGSLLLDVGRPEVFRHNHLKGAVNIPLDDLAARADELDRIAPVVVYGRGWFRAARAIRLLRTLGFRNVTSMGTGLASNGERVHAAIVERRSRRMHEKS